MEQKNSNLTFKQGNIFGSSAQVFVNPVNTVGVMGAGLAKQFKNMYPEYFKDYVKYCEKEIATIGTISMFPSYVEQPATIANFFTKGDWRLQSQYSYIQSGLEHLVRLCNDLEIESVAIPAVGCGLGGLFWPKVKAMMEMILPRAFNTKFEIYEPGTGGPLFDSSILQTNSTTNW